MGFTSKCPNCSAELEAEDDWVGLEAECPSCGSKIVISKQFPSKDTGKQCIKCLKPIEDKAVICTDCGTDQRTGQVLSATSSPPKTTYYKEERQGIDFQKTKTVVINIAVVLLLLGILFFWMNYKQQRADDTAFKEAEKTATIEAYEAYLKKFPDGKNEYKAKQGLEKLFFIAARDSQDIDKTKLYLQRYPNGKYTEEIHKHLDELTFAELTSPPAIDIEILAKRIHEHLEKDQNSRLADRLLKYFIEVTKNSNVETESKIISKDLGKPNALRTTLLSLCNESRRLPVLNILLAVFPEETKQHTELASQIHLISAIGHGWSECTAEDSKLMRYHLGKVLPKHLREHAHISGRKLLKIGENIRLQNEVYQAFFLAGFIPVQHIPASEDVLELHIGKKLIKENLSKTISFRAWPPPESDSRLVYTITIPQRSIFQEYKVVNSKTGKSQVSVVLSRAYGKPKRDLGATKKDWLTHVRWTIC